MKKLRAILAGILALAVLLFILWFVFGKEIGEECGGNLDCFGFSAMCVSIKEPPYRFCTRTCDGNSDCPDGWNCAHLPLFNKQDVSLKMKKICVTHF